jgi:hypothetical protein
MFLFISIVEDSNMMPMRKEYQVCQYNVTDNLSLTFKLTHVKSSTKKYEPIR